MDGSESSTIHVARLRDEPEAPFRFRLGDRVTWKHYDGTADREVQGIITDGTCIYTVNGGSRLPPIYVVTCGNGQKITAAEMTLMLVRLLVSEVPRFSR
jgi:hypothetical protein